MRLSQSASASGKARTYQRKFAPKVRSGCVTCRGRRVKCDEEKPACRRCSTYRVVCGGYINSHAAPSTPKLISSHASNRTRPLQNATKQETESIIFRDTKLVPILSQGASYGSYEEHHALYLYLSTVAVAISEFSSPNFWKVLIPQASWAHSGVKHALIALTWRQVSLRSVKADTTRPDELSIWHYNQSIRCLRLDIPTVEVILLACFLLFTYENTDGNFTVARKHMKSGLGIIKEWQLRYKASSKEGCMSQEIIPQFDEGLAYLRACSSGQPFLPTSSVPHRTRLAITTNKGEDVPDPPSTAATSIDGTFSSFEEACDALSECIRQTSFAHAAGSSTLTPLMLRWRRTLEASEHLTNYDPALLRMLNVHYCSCRTIGAALHSGIKDTKLACKVYLDDFVYIVNEMEFLIKMAHIRASSQLRQKLGFIPPLFMVALRCRDTHTRARAIKLLHTLRIKEGRWTSDCAAKISETCIRWETNELNCFDYPYVKPAKLDEQRWLGRIRVEASKDAAGHQTAWLWSESVGEPLKVELSHDDIDSTDWPILDVLDAYGYHDLSSK